MASHRPYLKTGKDDLGNDLFTEIELDAQTLSGKDVDSLTTEILKAVYPVGAIYLTVTNHNPGTIFGFGKWEQIKDRFLLAAGSTYSAGSTGGSATHTLTIDEMPSHTHTYQVTAWVNKTGDIVDKSNTEYIDYEIYRQTQATGGSQPHNNMPPYLTVYMWKRVS